MIVLTTNTPENDTPERMEDIKNNLLSLPDIEFLTRRRSPYSPYAESVKHLLCNHMYVDLFSEYLNNKVMANYIVLELNVDQESFTRAYALEGYQKAGGKYRVPENPRPAEHLIFK